jgi:hypothetical protein
VKGFRQKEASRAGDFELALAISGVCEAGEDVLLGKEWKFAEDIRVTHSASQVIQHVIHRNTQSANAGLASALPGFDGDDIGVSHEPTIAKTANGQSKTLLRLRI